MLRRYAQIIPKKADLLQDVHELEGQVFKVGFSEPAFNIGKNATE